eukprot:308581-Prorocentrum_minimum.AAC.1
MGDAIKPLLKKETEAMNKQLKRGLSGLQKDIKEAKRDYKANVRKFFHGVSEPSLAEDAGE